MVESEHRKELLDVASKRFAECFVRMLEIRGMTQTELATKLNVSRTSINGYTKGTLPTVATLIDISDTLQVSVDDLLGTTQFRRMTTDTYGDLTRALLKLIDANVLGLEKLVDCDDDVVLTVKPRKLYEFFKNYNSNQPNDNQKEMDSFMAMFNGWVENEIDKLDQTQFDDQATSNQ